MRGKQSKKKTPRTKTARRTRRTKDQSEALERATLDLIVEQGMENAEISKKLGISERLAKYYVESILRSFGAPNRIQLVIGYWRAQNEQLQRQLKAAEKKRR